MSITNIHNTPVFIRTGINNGLLKTQNAMPQKDSTSDGQSSFSADRRAYYDTSTLKPKITALNPPYLGMDSHTVFDGTHTAKQKQWYGNRDASEVTRRNRVQGVGLGTFNAQGQALSFESHANVNTVNSALSRVRRGGAVAPAKKAYNTNNAYGPTPKNIPLVPALKVANGFKMPPTKYAGPINNNIVWKYQNQNTP
jgi:hypothetical protein